MSGPKVVRVVTREELVAAGDALLSMLNHAVSDWQGCAGVGGVSDADLLKTKGRRDELERMLREDKFAEFERSATAEIGFLSADATRRREVAAQERAVARARALNGKSIAQTLLRSSTPFNAEVQHRLQMASRGELSLEELNIVLSSASRSLATSQVETLTEEHKLVAARLRDGELKSIDSWQAEDVKADKRLHEVMADIAELELLKDVEGAASTQSKLEELLLNPNSPERSMRMDSLQMALRHSKFVARQKTRALTEIQHLGTQLSGRSSNTALLQRVEGAEVKLPLSDLEDILASAQEELVELQKAQAAFARRRAVLDGLAQLGYTLHEGLATATTEGGALVMKSPDRPGYGVQVSGAGDISRMQIRSVAFDKGRDVSKDRAEEETWCGDFSELKRRLASQGCQLVVEKALGVGSTPLREISVDEEDEFRRGGSVPNSKKLR